MGDRSIIERSVSRGGETGDFKQVLAGAIYREIGARNFYKTISDSIKNAEGKESSRGCRRTRKATA